MKIPEPKKQPSGNWFVRLRLGGESIPITAPTRQECSKLAALYKAEYLNGKKISASPSALTLSSAIDRYIEDRKNILSPSTLRGYRTIQRNRFVSVMDKPISSVNNWQRVVNAEAKLCSPKTLKNAYGFVVSVLSENGVNPGIGSAKSIINNGGVL